MLSNLLTLCVLGEGNSKTAPCTLNTYFYYLGNFLIKEFDQLLPLSDTKCTKLATHLSPTEFSDFSEEKRHYPLLGILFSVFVGLDRFYYFLVVYKFYTRCSCSILSSQSLKSNLNDVEASILILPSLLGAIR